MLYAFFEGPPPKKVPLILDPTLACLALSRRTVLSWLSRLLAWPLEYCRGLTGVWLAGNEGVEKKMEIAIMGFIGTTIRLNSFIPS